MWQGKPLRWMSSPKERVKLKGDLDHSPENSIFQGLVVGIEVTQIRASSP